MYEWIRESGHPMIEIDAQEHHSNTIKVKPSEFIVVKLKQQFGATWDFVINQHRPAVKLIGIVEDDLDIFVEEVTLFADFFMLFQIEEDPRQTTFSMNLKEIENPDYRVFLT